MSWVKKLKKNVKSAIGGAGHSKAGKKYLAAKAAQGLKMKGGKVVNTMATENVEKRLRKAGLTEDEIKKLR